MKRFLGIVIILLFNSCDDGNMQFTSFNFGTAAVKKCILNNLIYKINAKEALILSIPQEVFDKTENTKTLLTDDTDNSQIKVLYRLFSDNVSDNTFCSVIPPANPVVVNEWKAKTGGTIEITTKAIYSTPDPTTGKATVGKYTHSIIFKNMVFVKGTDQLVFANYLFGNYETNAG